MMDDKYVKVVIPGLITYFKWFEDSFELDDILAEPEDESIDPKTLVQGKFGV